MKHRTCIAVSGYLWLSMGVWLLYKGLHLISMAIAHPDSYVAGWKDPQQAATCLIALGLFIGFIKGRFVLSKTVKRVSERILTLPAPVQLKNAYGRSYWILIGFMMLLGMLFRFLPIPLDFRGTVDVAIGSALMNGAMLYFRTARTICGTGSLSQSQ